MRKRLIAAGVIASVDERDTGHRLTVSDGKSKISSFECRPCGVTHVLTLMIVSVKLLHPFGSGVKALCHGKQSANSHG
jgi:hypothetical protein